MATTLTHLMAELDTLERRRQEIKEAWVKEDASCNRDIEVCRDKIKLLTRADMDVEKVLLAEKCLKIRGDVGDPLRHMGRHAMLREAAIDIATGCQKLRREYLGMKNYAHFGDQRSNHPYGYGPSHGSIVFAIELHDRVRTHGRTHETILTLEESDACIYYLYNYVRICDVRREGQDI